ncbi:hypothetical protein VZH09_01385 [Synechococcus elongatus IITB7]|uniref:hypothetical protein n=1 Tax=Synechococcus elongatus TaxID=32046 RepID=UPI0030CEB5DC
MPAKLPAIALSLTLAIGPILGACSQQKASTEKPEESVAVQPQAVLATWLEEPGWTTIGANPQGTRAQIKTPKRISSEQPIFRTEFRYLDRLNPLSGIREDNCLQETTKFIQDPRYVKQEDSVFTRSAERVNYNDMVFAYVCQTSSGKLTPGSNAKDAIEYLQSLGYIFLYQASSESNGEIRDFNSRYLTECQFNVSSCTFLFQQPSLHFTTTLKTDGRNLIAVEKDYLFLKDCGALRPEIDEKCIVFRDYFSYRDQNLDFAILDNAQEMSKLVGCNARAITDEWCSSVAEYRFKDGFLYVYKSATELGLDYSWLPNAKASTENDGGYEHFSPAYNQDFFTLEGSTYTQGSNDNRKPIAARFQSVKKYIYKDKKTGKLYCNARLDKLPRPNYHEGIIRYRPNSIVPENGYICTESGWRYVDRR